MTSLFAQSRDQHDMPSCSMRKTGSGNLTVRDKDSSLATKKKSAHQKQAERHHVPGVLYPRDLVQHIKRATRPQKFRLVCLFFVDVWVVRLPTWCYFSSHPRAIDEKTRTNLVMSGQRTPFDFLRWPAFQA